MKKKGLIASIAASLLIWAAGSVWAGETAPMRLLIHMKTSLTQDDAQICAVPNVAWAAVKAGHKVTILVDGSAITSVTKGYGWFNGIFRAGTTALDRATLPGRERETLSQQMNVPLDKVPHDYGQYFEFLKKMGVDIYGNQTMMLLYKVDPSQIASAVTPVTLNRMVELFTAADRVIVY